MTWTMLRYRFRRLWRRLTRPFRVAPMPPARAAIWEEDCAHDIVPLPDNPEWGRCTKCGDDTFPLTAHAAYSVQCWKCMDTGLVPDFSRPHVFADRRCPACGGGP